MEYTFDPGKDKGGEFGGGAYYKQALHKDIIKNNIDIHPKKSLNNEVIYWYRAINDM